MRKDFTPTVRVFRSDAYWDESSELIGVKRYAYASDRSGELVLHEYGSLYKVHRGDDEAAERAERRGTVETAVMSIYNPNGYI